MMPPDNRTVGTRHGSFAPTGFDALLCALLPRTWAARLMARKIVRVFGRPTGKPGDLTFQLPGWPVYEIVDAAGHVKPFTPNN